MKAQLTHDTIGIDVPSQGTVRISLQPEDQNEENLLDYLCADEKVQIRKSESGEDWEYAYVMIEPASSKKVRNNA